MPDSTIVKVHQDGTEAPANRGAPFKMGTGQAIGRSRGGLTTKLHALVLEDRLPLIMTLTPGHWGDALWGRWLLERLSLVSGQPQMIANRARNAIERYFGRIKRFRGIASHYHKLAHVYLNQIILAGIHCMTK